MLVIIIKNECQSKEQYLLYQLFDQVAIMFLHYFVIRDNKFNMSTLNF